MAQSVVWKFDVPKPADDGVFEIPLPEDAIIRHIDYDGRGQLCMWVEIPDASNAKIMPRRRFRAVPTGQEFQFKGKFLCTVIQRSDFPILGALVFHIYQLVS